MRIRNTQPDRIIIGAGLYGLYAARFCMEKGENVIVLEQEAGPFQRATYINQARVHMGYHYPRSLSTAMRSAGYFRRFCDEYSFCIKQDFTQIYATSGKFSWTDAAQFEQFCERAGIPCTEAAPGAYFREGMCDGAFITQEYTYDANLLCQYFMQSLTDKPNAELVFDARITEIEQREHTYIVRLSDGTVLETPCIVNAGYASSNQIISMIRGDSREGLFDLKYELCEIIVTKASPALEKLGITVMDGPFFSVMPFGETGYHSLTSVTFTPHLTSYDKMPVFPCQERQPFCTPERLYNCNLCPQRPESAWPYMHALMCKYLKDQYDCQYVMSLFSMKPILKASEVDDSRPVAIRTEGGNGAPYLISVLSGKINTVYDLEEYLK
ncbi:MAG: FAD-binding oxidoreductase [Lachnospiraceae bacterium]|nr:FAD-binding oxidoreductase [Lachnospiraceae bacterium]